MIKTALNILIIEDKEADFESIRYELVVKSRGLTKVDSLVWGRSIKEGISLLKECNFDIILLDNTLPDAINLEGIHKLRSLNYPTPIILLTEQDNEKIALQALHEGAQDYIVKGVANGALLRAIRYSIERYQIILELERLKEETSYANEAKSLFLAKMSHEISTPLTAIMGFTDIALNRASDTLQQKMLEGVMRNGKHLLQIVNHILDFTKIESGKMESSKKPFALIPLLEAIKETFSFRAKERNLFFELNINYPLVSQITTDELFVSQILLNLISNSLKFTKEGGIFVDVSLDEEDETIQFRIIDTGAGIDKDSLEKLFNAFEQGDNSSTRQYGGTGLGLSISRKLAEEIGGRIFVESEIDKGSVFTLEVPIGKIDPLSKIDCWPSAESTDEQESVTAEIPKLAGKILIADDVPDNCDLISYHLKSYGLKSTIVHNGQEALELAIDEQFDLILLDMEMPILDGYECAKQIRNSGMVVPIVAITANAVSGAIAKCLESGCDEYIRKPFKKEDLYVVLKKYLDKNPIDSGLNEDIVEDLTSQSFNSADFDDDPELVNLCLKFVNRLPERLSGLKQMFNDDDWTGLQESLHKLAPSELFGFPALGDNAQELEIRIKNNDRNNFEVALNSFFEIADGVVAKKDSLEKLLKELSV